MKKQIKFISNTNKLKKSENLFIGVYNGIEYHSISKFPHHPIIKNLIEHDNMNMITWFYSRIWSYKGADPFLAT